MGVSEDIMEVSPENEFRVCPSCGYEYGFHVSFLRDEGKYRIILICPQCGARYYTGWNVG